MEPKLDLSGITIGDKDDHMGGYEFTTSPNDTITLSSLNYGHNYPNTMSSGGYTTAGTFGPFTINNGVTNTSPWYSQTTSSTIQLDGDNADIKVNGWSLVDAIQKIEERLNILHPNEKLETEWEELFELGKKYRALEQQIKEKQATWDRLKAMPPPAID